MGTTQVEQPQHDTRFLWWLSITLQQQYDYRVSLLFHSWREKLNEAHFLHTVVCQSFNAMSAALIRTNSFDRL